MDKDNNKKKSNHSNDEQHTRKFDAVISPSTDGRNIMRPEGSKQNDRRDVYISQNKKPQEGEEQYIMRTPPTHTARQQGSGGSIPVSKSPSVRRTPTTPNNAADKAGKATAPPAPRQKAQVKDAKIEEKRKNRRSNFIFFSVLLTLVLLASTIISAYALTSLNDILALSRSNEKVTVLITENMTTEDVIGKLKNEGLIKNESFCLLFSKFLKYDQAEYMPGIHELRPNMGLEGMLITVRSSRTSNQTVSLVFPEGYTVDQIFAKLEEHKVCTTSSLYSTLKEVDFSNDFSFIKQIENKDARYRYMEGYLYPDTYNFYIGENASSVIKKFLNNFQNRWTDEYEEQAEKLNMSVDQVISLASIIEKEGKNRDQMFTISAILYNRLNDRTGSLQRLDCDSTYGYIMNIDKELITANQYDRLFAAYDTYQIIGLPPGPICNPGDNAINAALFAESTNYNFFRHDKAGKIYLATTLSEHNANERLVNAANADS